MISPTKMQSDHRAFAIQACRNLGLRPGEDEIYASKLHVTYLSPGSPAIFDVVLYADDYHLFPRHKATDDNSATLCKEFEKLLQRHYDDYLKALEADAADSNGADPHSVGGDDQPNEDAHEATS